HDTLPWLIYFSLDVKVSYEYFEPRRKGCTPFGCGWTGLALGLALALTGWFWHYPALTYSRGTVIELQQLSSYAAWHITYEYMADGARYRGERLMRLSTQALPFYRVGSSFPVYFVTAHPEQSYGPNRPGIQPLIVIGVLWAAAGSMVVYFAWPQ